MPKLKLTRVGDTGKETFGVLSLNENPVMVTLERPWQNNARGVSCIPAGVYKCVRNNTAAHPDTWRLLDVKGRDGILIHIGNKVEDSRGCILVGMEFATRKVIRSTEAMKHLNALLANARDFELEVV